jgi:uncharacterized protein involved in type VI secretion and phage assembly
MSRRVVRIRKWSVVLMALCVLVAGLGFAERTDAQGARRHPGVAIAIVVEVVDPQAAGRIKVKFPWLPDAPELWARVSLPLGGNQHGFWTLPEVGDEVVVAFEHGNLRRPIVLGSLWNGKDRPTK